MKRIVIRQNGSGSRHGGIGLLLLVAASAIALGLFLSWMKYQSTFSGVEEHFLVFQSRNMIERRFDDGSGSDLLKAERLTEFPLAEVVGGQTYDFGVAEPGQMLQHTFTILNSGNAPLELMLEGVTCKCLTMGLEKNKVVEVAPGDTLDIKLEWRSDSLTKSFQQYARLKTNDPENRRAQIELKVTGRIVSPVLAAPERLSCHLASSADSEDFEFMVHVFESKSVDPETFEVGKVQFNRTELNDYLEFRRERLTEEEYSKEPGSVGGYRVIGTVKPGAPKGVYIGKLEVETSSGHPVGLDLAVKVDAPVEIRPLKGSVGVNYFPESQTIEFGLLSDNSEPEFKMLMLYNIEGDDLEITLEQPAVLPEGYVKAEIQRVTKTGAGKMAHVRVYVPADCPECQFNGTGEGNTLRLTVKSNSKFAPEMVFPINISKKVQ